MLSELTRLKPCLSLSHIAHTCADKRVCHKDRTQRMSIDRLC